PFVLEYLSISKDLHSTAAGRLTESLVLPAGSASHRDLPILPARDRRPAFACLIHLQLVPRVATSGRLPVTVFCSPPSVWRHEPGSGSFQPAIHCAESRLVVHHEPLQRFPSLPGATGCAAPWHLFRQPPGKHLLSSCHNARTKPKYSMSSLEASVDTCKYN